MRKKVTLLIAQALIIPGLLLAQNDFSQSFNGKRPSRENIRIQLSDKAGNETYIPITIVKGKTTGPVFTIIAGVHGYEYPPIIASQEIIHEIDPNKLSGTLIIIPIANTSSFFGRSPFVSPQDGVNLNRAFPGSDDGSITQQIAYFITSEIIPVSDIFLDIHGGDANEDLLPFVCYYNHENKPEQTQLAKMLSEASGFEYIVSYPYTLRDDQAAKYAFKQAVQDGKSALSIECGKLGNVQKEAVRQIKQGVYNMLAHLSMYAETPGKNHNIIRLDNQAYIRSKWSGIFRSQFKAGDQVNEGEIVGYINDVFGKTIIEIKSPKTGIILYKIGTPPVNPDETIMCIGYES